MGDLNQYVGREVKGVKFENDRVGYTRKIDIFIHPAVISHFVIFKFHPFNFTSDILI